MKSKKLTAIGVIALGMWPALLAAASDTFLVASKIENGGTVVAEPVLGVRAGTPATVKVSGDSGYSMTVQVDPQENDLLQVTVRADTVQGSISSSTVTALDKPVTVSSGDIGLTVTVASGP